ncbi:MAG: T9SS type A sorting domain-containing protein [Bacteroidota bacterium]|nr:T9SS type A sorting domain-containing protein [Bacteroidota bacterium]MDP3147348.1 T9SS type A sorting domain-containing protein [Bacteroidota bacterium]
MKKIAFSILLVSFVFVKFFAQIPNNDFETWTTTSVYQSPNDWDNLNQITYSSGIYTCIKGTPGYSGASYLYLITKTIPVKGIVPGVAVCGEIDTVTYKPKSGFPYTNRPQFLSYYMQFMPYDPSDSSSVKILLTKWDQTQLKRDTIAFGASYFNSMAHSWFYNSTYLNYVNGNNPDSAIIVISSSSSIPKDGSYIYIDNLQFNGSVIGIDENNLNSNSVSIFPNPSMGVFSINYNLSNNTEVSIKIIDVLGREIFIPENSTQSSGQYKKEIDVDLPSGMYNVVLKTGNAITNKKIVIK